MRIVLHAGLHKSATTFTQSYWGQVYDVPGAAWYPVREDHRPTGHSYLFRPLLRAFTALDDPDLVLAALTAPAEPVSLADVVAEAEAHGVGTLVLSSEDVDRAQPADLPAIAEALGGHELTLLLTATKPVHRWCANWQTMVRRGLADNPRASAPMVERISALTPGRLEELLRMLPAARHVVRLVQTDPAEPDLPRDLARLVGLPEPTSTPEKASRNVSLGVETEVLRRINAAGQGIGSFRGGSQRLGELRAAGFTFRDLVDAEPDFALSDTAWESARVERDLLAAPPADLALEVHDPHGLLPDWLDPTLPEWYDEISRREAVLPELESLPHPAEQLWRVRQERAAYLTLLRASEQQTKQARQRARRGARRVAELEQQVRDLGGTP